MERVLVIGCSGAGKTTFAVQLAARTGLPLLHLDQVFWRPGWTVTPRAEWRARVARLVSGDCWILEGNDHNSLDLRLPRADTVIWFDLPRHLCLRRVAKLLKWIWHFNRTTRPTIQAMLDRHAGHLKPIVFRHDRDVRAFLACTLENQSQP